MVVGVGVGVLVLSRGRALVGRRLGSHGEGTWGLPGGWLENGEEFVPCALRELEEEAGLATADVLNPIVAPVVANSSMELVHTVTVFVKCSLGDEALEGKVTVREPDKCSEWRWVGLRELGEGAVTPLFAPLEFLVQSEWWASVLPAKDSASHHVRVVRSAEVPPTTQDDLPHAMYAHGATGPPECFAFSRRQLGTQGVRLGCSLMEVPPGKSAWPFHAHASTEEAVYVLSGRGRQRIGHSEVEVGSGDYIALPTGPPETHGHQLVNTDSVRTLRYLCLSASAGRAPGIEVCVYPESGKVGVFAEEACGVDALFPLEAKVPYYSGEDKRKRKREG